jgi:hypothetical protein
MTTTGEAPAEGGAEGGAEARIFDRGYRPYDGERRGVRGAVLALTKHTVQRVLGLKRTFWNKILPTLTIFLAYVPAIVFVGVYLASPLRRDTYLLAKAAAIGFVISIVTLGPPLFMLIARTIAGVGPNGPGGVLAVLWRVIVSGVIVGLLPAVLSLAVSSTTTRRAVASAAIVLILLGSIAVSESLIAAGASHNFFVLNLAYLPLEIVIRIYGEPAGTTLDSARPVATSALVLAYVVMTVGLALFVRWRYQRIEVTR